MKTIVAIGGGEMGRTKTLEDGSLKVYPIETTLIDAEVVRLSGKKHPKLLFLGTACNDRKSYLEVVKEHYGNRLGCRVVSLNLARGKSSYQTIKKRIASADIIYVGGGDTRKMLEVWKQTGADKLIVEAYHRGCILSGISAGAICWFDFYDNCDYKDEPNWRLEFLEGLGLVQGFAVPHYDNISDDEKSDIKSLLKEKNLTGVAIDDCAAFVITDNNCYFISSKEGKCVYKL